MFLKEISLDAKKTEVINEFKKTTETEQHNFTVLTKKFVQDIKDDLLTTKSEFLTDIQKERSAINHEVELIKAELHKELLEKLEAHIKEIKPVSIFDIFRQKK